MSESTLTVRQLADRFKVATSTARAWCLQGKIPGAKLQETALGSYWVIPASGLNKFEPPRRGPKPKKKGAKK